jgi:ribosomal protein L16 Arg81 hydroxylase
MIASTEARLESLEQFSRLFHPLGVEEFLDRYYEQRALHVRRDDADYYASLLNAGDIDRLFENTAIARSIIRITKEGKELHSDKFAEVADGSTTDRLSNDRALRLFEDGYTLIINGASRVFPNLDRFCMALEREVGFRVNPNIYITPFNAQGFDTHYDDHDVFILQVMGTKNWRIYHSAVELPSKRQKFRSGVHKLGAPEMEITLSPGECLYIPRGYLHDARTDGVTSAHITLGLHPTYHFDLVYELAYQAQDLPAFRKSFAFGRTRDRATACREFKRLLTDLVDTLDVDGLVERRHKHFVRLKRLDYGHRFRDLARLNELNLGSTVRRRPDVVCAVERNGRSITVSFGGNNVPVQPFLDSALESILGEEPFAVRDIQGFLTDKSRMDLVRTFLAAGLLEVVEWNRGG